MKIINHQKTTYLNEIDDQIYKFIAADKKIDYSLDIFTNSTKKEIDARKCEIKSFIKQLNELKKLPYMKQRSQEWLDARKNILTASNLDDALSNNCLKLAKTKAGVIIDNTDYSTIAPLKWGTMFEEMASRCYSQRRNDICIHEFVRGCVCIYLYMNLYEYL